MRALLQTAEGDHAPKTDTEGDEGAIHAQKILDVKTK